MSKSVLVIYHFVDCVKLFEIEVESQHIDTVIGFNGHYIGESGYDDNTMLDFFYRDGKFLYIEAVTPLWAVTYDLVIVCGEF